MCSRERNGNPKLVNPQLVNLNPEPQLALCIRLLEYSLLPCFVFLQPRTPQIASPKSPELDMLNAGCNKIPTCLTTLLSQEMEAFV